MRILFSEQELQKKVKDLARQLNAEYQGKDNIVMVYIEKGGKFFFDKLMEQIGFNVETDSIRVKSYDGTESGILKWLKKPSISFDGKVCILVDDILDTGKTMKKVKEFILKQGAVECKICVAVNKHERRLEYIHPDYHLLDLDEGFIVGFGMDYNEQYRELPAIYTMDEN